MRHDSSAYADHGQPPPCAALDGRLNSRSHSSRLIFLMGSRHPVIVDSRYTKDAVPSDPARRILPRVTSHASDGWSRLRLTCASAQCSFQYTALQNLANCVNISLVAAFGPLVNNTLPDRKSFRGGRRSNSHIVHGMIPDVCSLLHSSFGESLDPK